MSSVSKELDIETVQRVFGPMVEPLFNEVRAELLRSYKTWGDNTEDGLAVHLIAKVARAAEAVLAPSSAPTESEG